MTSVLRPSTTTPTCHYPSSPSASLSSSVTTSSTTSRSVAFTSTMPTEGFAFASIKGSVHLVQVNTTHNTPILELKIFRHEFITIFRFSHSVLVDPSEIRILESISDACAMYEEESDTVVLAKDLTERLLSRRASGSPSSKRYSAYGPGRYTPMGMQRAYGYR